MAITANPSACNEATNTFSVTGNIEFSNPPTTGTLTITDNTAVPPVSQTFVHPFSSPLPYTLSNIPCDGTIHNLTASFSDSVNCTLTHTYSSPGPICPQALISGGGTICSNSTQPATVSVAFPVGTPPFTFIYAINGINQAPIVHNSTTPYQISTTTPGTYTLVSLSNTNCTSGTISGSATVTVNPLPTANVSGSTSVCQNGPAPAVTFTGGNASPPYTFTYNINGGSNQTISTTSGNSVTLTAPTTASGVYNYNLVSVQESSATSCSQLQTGTAVITVNPLPAATITGTTNVCVNAPEPLITLTGSGGTPPYIFSYNINGGSTQTITTVTGSSVTLNVPTATSGSFIYNLLGVQESSSTTCSQLQTGSATVTVNPLPAATIGGTVSVCQGSASTNIIFTGASGTPPYTFTYKLNGGADQTIATTAGNSVTLPVSTATAGVFSYSLVSVQDGSATTCQQAQTGTATVTVNPVPSATINGSVAVCLNDASPLITFTGSGGTSPYTFTYNINGGASQAVTTTSGNSVTVAVPTGTAGTFTYNLLGVQESSSTTCSQAQGGSATVTVNPRPSATISGSVSICQGSTSPDITFTGSGGTQPYTFTYNINGGTSQTITTTTGNSVTVSVPTTTAGVLNYNLVGVQDGSSTHCTQAVTGSATVTVNPLPVADFTFISGCENSATQFTDASTTPTGTTIISYAWNFGDGGTSALRSPQHTYLVYGTYPVNLTVVNSNGCTHTVTRQVTANPKPVAGFTNSAATCIGNPVTFTDLSFIPSGFSGYINKWVWDFGDGTPRQTILYPNSPNVAYIFAGTATSHAVKLIVTTTNGCVDSITHTVNSIPLPLANFNYSNTLCFGQVVHFTDLSQTNGGGSLQTWNWTFGDPLSGTSNISTLQNPDHSFSASGAFRVDLNVTSINGCISTYSLPVTVNPLPTASVSGTIAVCEGSASPKVVFTGASATPPYTFSYNINGGPVQTVTTTTGNTAEVQVPTAVPGIYTYNLVSVQDAGSPACSQLQPGSATVTVNPLPAATIAGTTTLCQDSPAPSVTFTGGLATPPYTFTYKINGGSDLTVTTTSGNSVSVTVPTATPGTYIYKLVSVKDGSSTSCIRAVGDSATVTVKPLPLPAVTGPSPICLNSTGSYTTASGMTGYNWSVSPGGSILSGGTTSSVSILWGSTGSKTVSVNYIDGNGCTAHAATNFPVTVSTLPAPTLTGTTSICTGIPVTYTTEAGMQSYTWTVSAGGTVTSGGQATDHTITITWNTAGSNSLSVNYVAGNNCTAASPTPLTVTVNPSAAPTITCPVNPVCAASSATYTTQTGMSGYTWTVSAGGTISSGAASNAVTVTWNTAGTQSVKVNYTNNYGCTAVSPANFDVQVNPLPETTITEATGPVCQSVPHLYQVPVNSACTFAWSVLPAANGSFVSGQGSNAVSIDWQVAGSAVLAVNGLNSNTGCTSSSTLAVVVRPKPVPVFTPCFDVVTTPGAKKIILRGGAPFLTSQGVFSGNRVALNSLTGNYEFNPAGAPAGNYAISYTYTNTFGCPATAGPVTIAVQNVSFSCGGDLTDVRDGKKYKTAYLSGRCWMTENLNYGTALTTSPVPPQSDNCVPEKYCSPSDPACSSYGGLYQWDELMDYSVSPGTKGLCPPEWHIPAEAEWQQLIDNLVTGNTAPMANAVSGSFMKDPFVTGGFHGLLEGLNYQDHSWHFYSGSTTGTFYWTSQPDSGGGLARGLNVYTSSISRYISGRGNAFSVRCVKD